MSTTPHTERARRMAGQLAREGERMLDRADLSDQAAEQAQSRGDYATAYQCRRTAEKLRYEAGIYAGYVRHLSGQNGNPGGGKTVPRPDPPKPTKPPQTQREVYPMELTEFRDSLTETRRKIKMLQSAQEIEPDEPTAHQISMEAEKAVVLARAIQDAELPDAIDDALSTCYTNMALQGDDTLAGVLGPDLARISALRLNRLVPELNLPPVVTPAPTSIDRVCDHIDPPAPPIDALTPKPSEPTSPPIDALTPRGEKTTDPPPSPPVQTHDVSEDPPGEETTDQDSTPPGYSHDVPDGYRRMRSRFAGTCKGCGDRFAKGTLIDWAARVGAYHPGCVPSATRVNDEEFDF